MKLLLLTYHFPPRGTAGSMRNYAMATVGCTVFQEVVVAKAAFTPQVDDSIPEPQGCNLIEIPNWDYRFFFGKLASKANGKSFVWRKIRGVLGVLLPGLWTEGGLWYVIRGYQLANRCLRDAEDWVIYSSYRPMADHWIAFLLKLRYRKIHWIADFRDLPPGRNAIRHVMLRFMLQQAEMVSTVSKGLAAKLESLHPKVVTMPNVCFPPGSLSGTPVVQDYFRIVYTGSLYSRQSLFPLPKALASLFDEGLLDPARVRLVYAGKDGGIWDRRLGDFAYPQILENKGLLTLAASRALQAGAAVNLLLSWCDDDHCGILTSKFFEYLEAGQPILGIVNGNPDPELEDWFNRSHAGELAYAHEGCLRSVRQFILEKYRMWIQEGQVPACVNREFMAQFSWENNMKMICRQINKSIHEKSTVPQQLVSQPHQPA